MAIGIYLWRNGWNLHIQPRQYSAIGARCLDFAGARGKVLLIINLSKPEKARVH